jgi:hypothetical protein
MRNMDFLNYVQRPYTNVTVRRGYKWADLPIGGTIMLCDNGDSVETAVVRQVLIKRFSDVKPEDLRREYDPSCTHRHGLLKSMVNAYPDFTKDEPVTIVTYVRGINTLHQKRR